MIKPLDDHLAIAKQNWEKYTKYKDTAEQHMFPVLLCFDMKLEPLYADLQVNPSTHHAAVFNAYMRMKVFPVLGIE